MVSQQRPLPTCTEKIEQASLSAFCRALDVLVHQVLSIIFAATICAWSTFANAQIVSHEKEKHAQAAQYFFTRQTSIEQTQKAILTAFKNVRDAELKKRYRRIDVFGTVFFNADMFLNGNVEQTGKPAHENPSLTMHQWQSLPVAERKYDILITPDVDYYWRVDYYKNGKKIDFTTGFILHLHSMGPNTTTVSVIQSNSMVRLGKKFFLMGRAGPGFYWDIRLVDASPEAAAELLEFLAAELSHQ